MGPSTTYVLLVTWFAFNQPPVSSQTTFHSAAACNAARAAVMADQARLQAAQDQHDVQVRGQPGLVAYNPIPAPTVSAVCAPE